MRGVSRSFSLVGLVPWQRVVVLGPPGSGKTGTVLDAVAGLSEIAGFVQEADAARDRYTLRELRGDGRRLIAWRTPAGMRFDHEAFALAKGWLGPARGLVLDEIGWLEAEGKGHASALQEALAREVHVLCAVRADRWPVLRARFVLESAIVVRSGDVSGVRALLDNDFRLARARDIEALGALEQRADQRFASVGHPELADGAVMPREAAERAIERSQIVVAHRGGQLAGFAYVGTAGDEPCLGQIAVDPAFGQRGIGTALLRIVKTRMHMQGARTLVLSTQRDVPWNQPWYARHGFVEVAESQWTEAMRAITWAQTEAGLDAATRMHMRCALDA